MESDAPPGAAPGEGYGDGYYAWPRPLSQPTLRTLKKALLIGAALLGVHQFVPAGNAGSLVSELLTIALILSWLAPMGRVYARLAGRRGRDRRYGQQE
jgi:hypothetical protein